MLYDRLVVYREGTKSEKELIYGKDNTKFLNISKRNIDDIRGMRFKKLIICKCCTCLDSLKMQKFIYSDKRDEEL